MKMWVAIQQYLLIFLLLFVMGPSVVLAQENPEEMAKKYNISFPIAELGNCTNFVACKSYCDSQANRETCMSFAKKKGFAKEETKSKNTALLQEAKSQLGCDSETSCRSICEQEANIDKCRAFAQKHNLGGPKGRPGDRQILQKAKEILGCDSESSCRAVCENAANQEKCSEFAKQSGLGGGVRRVGPGGCNSGESCRSYCETHMDECRKFGDGGGSPGENANRRGPGGCDSEESCKAYCEKNPDDCRKFGGEAPQGDAEQFCKDNPDKCAQGIRGPNPEEFCKNNPDKCSGGRMEPAMNPDEYCKQNPDKCRPPAEANRRYDDSFKREPQFQQPRQREDLMRGEPYQENRLPQYEQQKEQPPPQQLEQRPQEETRTAPLPGETSSSVQGSQIQKSIFQIIQDFLSGKF